MALNHKGTYKQTKNDKTHDKLKKKKYICNYQGCTRSFTRQEHLGRHFLNHRDDLTLTCDRCRATFRRKDLLQRHIERHKMKDIEAGGEGLGKLETRKRCWKDENGNIVTKRPNLYNISSNKNNIDNSNKNKNTNIDNTKNSNNILSSNTESDSNSNSNDDAEDGIGFTRDSSNTSDLSSSGLDISLMGLSQTPPENLFYLNEKNTNKTFSKFSQPEINVSTNSTKNQVDSNENPIFLDKSDIPNTDSIDSSNGLFKEQHALNEELSLTDFFLDSSNKLETVYAKIGNINQNGNTNINSNTSLNANANSNLSLDECTYLEQCNSTRVINEAQPFIPDPANSFTMPFTTLRDYSWMFGDPISADSANFSFDGNNITSNNNSDNNNFIHNNNNNYNINNTNTNLDKELYSRNQFYPIIDYTDQNLSPEKPIQSNYELNQFYNHNQILYTQPSPPPSCEDKDKDFIENKNLKDSINMKRSLLPIIDEVARKQIISIIIKSLDDNLNEYSEKENIISEDNPLLSIDSLQNYSDLYFSRFNTTYPLLHCPTFRASEVHPLLLISVLTVGASYASKEAHKMAVRIHDGLRGVLISSSYFSATPELWVLQTFLLIEVFGKWRAGMKQHDMSHLFHGLLINLIRRSDCQTAKTPSLSSFNDSSADLEEFWKLWIIAESKKRLAILCFMWDVHHAVLFAQTLCMSAFELRVELPEDSILWEAESAEEWLKLQSNDHSSYMFLSTLKKTLHCSNDLPTVNLFSRAFLLHGLMSIFWDMQRRDQTSLGFNDDLSKNWRARISKAYDCWKVYFDAGIKSEIELLRASNNNDIDNKDKQANYMNRQEITRKQYVIERYGVAINAIYHCAHIALYSDIIDLQICAGANNIMGRPIGRLDYMRARSAIKSWAISNPQSGVAVWHAAKLIQEAFCRLPLPFNNDTNAEINTNTNKYWNSLDPGKTNENSKKSLVNFDVDTMFHYPWCVYVAVLVSWAFPYGRGLDKKIPNVLNGHSSNNITKEMEHGQELVGVNSGIDEDYIVWDANGEMISYLKSITSIPMDNMLNFKTVYQTGGLINMTVRNLGGVRWALVYEACKVLQGLVASRLIKG